MKTESQHDNHVWMVANGKSYAIRRIKGSAMYLWRGYEPDIEYGVVDTSGIDWEGYCESAVRLLRSEFQDFKVQVAP